MEINLSLVKEFVAGLYNTWEVQNMSRVLVIIMAGGVGERLQPLTRERSKASVPFGGKFRLIDFTLSNCINSGLRQIFVLTQYRSESLHQHIQDGWGISNTGLGDFIYTIPPQLKMGEVWYRGTADAVRQNLNLINNRKTDYVLVLSGDHIYKMNYRRLIDYHISKKASLTIPAVRVCQEQAAGRLGVLEANEQHKLVGFEEKPAQPKTLKDSPELALASMGIYLFNVEALNEALRGEEEDFGKHIVPKMISRYQDIFIYDYEKENLIRDYIIQVKDGIRDKITVEKTRDSSYWRDVGTIDSYHEASMDLISIDPLFNLYGEMWPLRTLSKPLPPSKCVLGGKAPDCLVSDGCIISGGTIWYSVLSPGVIVERDAIIEQSVIFDNVIIEPGVRIKKTIIDKESKIQAGASLGFDRETDINRGCTVSPNGITVVPKGAIIRRSDPSLFD
jgi:glucose-1-phosphate adenylyltransferase